MAPVSVVAGILVWRRQLAGPLLALGPSLYALYMYSQLALGGDVVRYPGNSERFFPLYLALFILAGVIAFRAWTVLAAAELPRPSRTADRVFGWFSLLVAAFLAAGLHLPGLIDAWRDHPTGTEYLADPVVFWLVKMMDLGLVVPALVAIGVGVLRRTGWADKAKYAATGWIALLGSAVAGMAITMQITDDPAATTANTIAFSLFALIGLVIAATLYRPLFASGSRRNPSSDQQETPTGPPWDKGA